jgi:hypothetical protein
MKYEDLKKVKDFYDNIIMQGIIKPIEINEIYKLVCPECDTYISYAFKQRAIVGYVQTLQKQVLDEMTAFFKGIDETETAEITTPAIVGESSHSEDDILEMETIEDEFRNTPDNVVEFPDGIRVPKSVAEKMIPYTEDKYYQTMSDKPVLGMPLQAKTEITTPAIVGESSHQEDEVRDMVETPDGVVHILKRPTCEEVEAREKNVMSFDEYDTLGTRQKIKRKRVNKKK